MLTQINYTNSVLLKEISSEINTVHNNRVCKGIASQYVDITDWSCQTKFTSEVKVKENDCKQ